jgi:hypothetical protein
MTEILLGKVENKTNKQTNKIYSKGNSILASLRG